LTKNVRAQERQLRSPTGF